MTCNDYKDLMMGYLDNELSNDQRQTFDNQQIRYKWREHGRQNEKKYDEQ